MPLSCLPGIFDPDNLPGNAPQTGMLIQRCRGTGHRGIDVQALYPPWVRPHTERLFQTMSSSDLSANNLVNVSAIHESSPGMYRSDPVAEIDSHTPRPV